jgi:hypothetical protein
MDYFKIVEDKDYKELNEEERKEIRSAFFNQHIAPTIPEDERELKFIEFDADSREYEKEVWGSTPETKITDPEISDEQAYDDREFQRLAATNKDYVEAVHKLEAEKDIMNALSGADVDMEKYGRHQRILNKLNDTELRRSALAGVEDSTTSKVLKGVATKLGAEGFDENAFVKPETPEYGIMDILAGREVGEGYDVQSARDAFLKDMAYYGAQTGTDLLMLKGLGRGSNALVSSPVGKFLPGKTLLKSGLTFGSYSGLGTAADIARGAIKTDTPFADTMESVKHGGITGMAVGAVNPVSRILFGTGKLATKGTAIASKKLLNKTDVGKKFINKGEALSNRIKENIAASGKIAQKIKPALGTSAVLTAEDYTMIGINKMMQGGSFFDVTAKDMLTNSPLSFAMHSANAFKPQRVASLDKLLTDNLTESGILEGIREVPKSNEHSLAFGRNVADKLFHMSKEKVFQKDAEGNIVTVRGGKKEKVYDHDKTLENILENAKRIAPDTIREVFADPKAKEAFLGKLDANITENKKLTFKKYGSLKEYHEEIMEAVKDRSVEIADTEKQIQDLRLEYDQLTADILRKRKPATVLELTQELLQKRDQIAALEKTLESIKGNFTPFTRKEASARESIEKAKKQYDDYKNRTDIDLTKATLDNTMRADSRITNTVAEVLSLRDEQIEKVTKEAGLYQLKQPEGKIATMLYEARRWLQNSGRVLERAFGKEFAALIIPPMRAAEMAKTTEQIAKRNELLKYAGEYSKSDRIMVGIYLAARQGGDALRTVENMLATKKIKTGFFKSYDGGIPDAEMIRERGLDKLVEFCDFQMKDYWERLMQTRDLMGLEGLDGLENYFTLIRNVDKMKDYDLDFLLKGQKWNKLTENYTEELAAANRFTKERKGGTLDIELDPLIVLNIYGQAALKTIHLAPVSMKIEQIGEKLRETQEEGGQFVREVAMRFNGTLDNKIGGAIKQFGHTAYKNIVNSVLGLKFSTVVSQFTSLSNVMIKHGVTNTIETAVEMMENPELRRRCMEASLHLQTRVMDVTFDSKMGFGNKWSQLAGVYESLAFAPLKAVDMAVAQVSWGAAYRTAKEKLLLNEIDARNYADEQVVSLQGSASKIDRSRLQSSFVGKLATPFQTFTINQWNFLMSDVMGVDKVYKFQKEFKTAEDAEIYKATREKPKKYEVYKAENGKYIVYNKERTISYGKSCAQFASYLLFGYLTGIAYDEFNENKPAYMSKLVNPMLDPYGRYKDELDESGSNAKAVYAGVREMFSPVPIVGGGVSFSGDSITGALVQSGVMAFDDLQRLDPTDLKTYAPLAYHVGRVAVGVPGSDQVYRSWKEWNKYQKEEADSNNRAQKGVQSIKGLKSIKSIKSL